MLTNLQILNVAYFSFLFLNIAMDSFTQIVLGAACGEAVLGRKIGNKALLFGAICGTIPDLDVIIGGLLFNNEIDAMLFYLFLKRFEISYNENTTRRAIGF